jgi:hypothetical protein
MQFREWNKRGNFTSLSELRAYLGFDITDSSGRIKESCVRTDVALVEYFLFCEMIMNLINDLNISRFASDNKTEISNILNTIKYNVEKSGFEIESLNGQLMIMEKNAVSIKVADSVPDLSTAIIEYNHYLLQGDMKRKQEILKTIADSLEPKRQELNGINKTATDDFFWMVNNLNIRHNNCNKSDKNYTECFALMSPAEQEKWYDKIYDQALYLFVLLDSKSRSAEIKNIKQTVNK